jgi:ERCC4-type nuclease
MLEYGDACFEGNGPDDTSMTIGIERKTVGDMLNCIEDARYVAHQRPGMLAMYRFNFLIVEGIWKPEIDTGYMLELVGAMNWRPYRNRAFIVRYDKLFRYLISVQLAGTPVIMTRDLDHTAFNLVSMYRYFQKKWEDHTSLTEVQKLNIATLAGKPSLVRRWAEELEGVGGKIGQAAAQIFDTPLALAQADEEQWIKVPGVGAKLARAIVKSVRGW